jgi:hypothetical protein
MSETHGNINVRNVPKVIIRTLKVEAAKRGVTLRSYCLEKLTGMPWVELEIVGGVAAPKKPADVTRVKSGPKTAYVPPRFKGTQKEK